MGGMDPEDKAGTRLRHWRRGAVGYLMLNRPERANAYDTALLTELDAALARFLEPGGPAVLVNAYDITQRKDAYLAALEALYEELRRKVELKCEALKERRAEAYRASEGHGRREDARGRSEEPGKPGNAAS